MLHFPWCQYVIVGGVAGQFCIKCPQAKQCTPLPFLAKFLRQNRHLALQQAGTPPFWWGHLLCYVFQATSIGTTHDLFARSKGYNNCKVVMGK